jgi:spore coat polysaccharide biosynthesis protein SpsF
MKTGAIVQARFSSTRLPGKVLRELPPGSGVTVLGQVLRRLKKSKKIEKIIVATTEEKKARRIVDIAKEENTAFFKGHTETVLSRYFLCARENRLGRIVRISSDCPCIDPEIVDFAITEHVKTGADYTSNTVERTYPRGFDVEVFDFGALEKAYENASRDYEKEHVTPYIYERPQAFKVAQIKAPKNLRAPGIRITLDTEEDYALISAVFGYLYPVNKYFGASGIVNLFRKKPHLASINMKVAQKKIK